MQLPAVGEVNVRSQRPMIQLLSWSVVIQHFALWYVLAALVYLTQAVELPGKEWGG